MCAVCGKTLDVMQSEISHRIPQGKKFGYLQKYGPEVIHHRLNLVLAHHDCNSAVSISNHPLACEKLAAEIIAERIGRIG